MITAKHQETMLAELHLNHPGIMRMKSLARLHVWWPALDSDIEQLVGDYETCQITHSKAPVTFNIPGCGHTDLGSEFMLISVVHFLVDSFWLL